MKKTVTKILVLIAILSLLTPVSTADKTDENITADTNVSNENLTIDTNVSNDLTTEEIKILKELIKEGRYKEKSLSTKERMEKAKVPSDVINATIPSTEISTKTSADITSLYDLLVYDNPVLGVSIRRTGFTKTIYNNNYANWASWNFYLPENSYAYIDVSGNVNGFKDYKEYVMSVDSQYTNWAYDIATCRDTGWFSSQPACYQEIQRSKLFYLLKGSHTINLNGYANPYGTSYSVNGFISLIAIPEYTAIKVTSPNGGENWTRNTTRSITWAKYGRSGTNVKIELYKGGVLNTVIATVTPNDGTYSWYIPSFQPTGTDYKINISSTSEPTKYYDWSDNNFKIS